MSEKHPSVWGSVIGWGGYAFSHLAQINTVLQFTLLVMSIIATGIALYRSAKKP